MKQFKICKIAPKTLGICRGVLLDHKNSGGVSSPRATATGGTWVHAPPLETPKKPRDLECLLPLCLPTPAVRVTVTCKNLKIHKAVGFSFFFLVHGSICFRFGSAFLVSPSSLLHCSLLVAASAVDSRLEMGPFLWAPLEEEGLMLVNEEAGRRRLAFVEVVAAEEIMGMALWWRSSAAVVGLSRCGWRLEGKWGYCDVG